jgi:tetratricopeptide (TPR) repeat protein
MGKASGKIITDAKTPSYDNRIWTFLQKPILHILLIAIVGLLAYSNTFDVPFNFDDIGGIAKNPIIKDLNYFVEPSRVKGLIIDGRDIYKALKARYIGFLTLGLNYSVHGLEVTGYHVVNLAIHIINALLVYYLVVLTFRTSALRRSSLRERSSFIAVLSALLFVSHPIQTQAVTYIAQRLTSLATLFYLLSFVMYIKTRAPETERNTESLKRKNKIRPVFYCLISIGSAVLAMKTKEIAFTLPVIIAIYDFIFLKGRMKRRILYLIPLLLTMLIIPISLIDFDKPIGEVIADISDETQYQKSISRSEYFYTQIRVIVTYIRLLFLPINQNLDYDYPIYHSLFDPEVFLSLIFLLSVFGLGVYIMYRYRNTIAHTRLMAFGIFWFFVTQAVESSIVLHVIFEHRVYLPSVGFFLASVTGLAMLVERINSKVTVRVIIAGVITAVLMLGGTTYGRNKVWQNEITLWEDVVMKSPKKARPHNNLGYAYAEQNRLDEAISELKIALQFKPDFADAYHNLGNTYAKQSRLNDAISAYKAVLRFRHSYVEAYIGLGVVYVKQNRLDEAISAYKTVLRFNPDHFGVYYNLGNTYLKQNRLDEAISAYKTVLRFNPYDVGAYNNLGAVYAKQNRLDEAISEFKTALQFKPDHADAYNNLGVVYVKQNRLDKAISEFKTALQFKPDHAEARENLKRYYEAIKKMK